MASSSEAEAEAKAACDETSLDGMEFSWSIPYREWECCIVFGLSKNTKIEQLKDLFSPYGDIVEIYIDIFNDEETGDLKGIGYVSFEKEKSFYDAFEALNGYILEGHTITILVSKVRKYVENYGRYLSGPEIKTQDSSF